MSASAISSSPQGIVTNYQVSPPILSQGRKIKKISFSDGLKAVPVFLGKVVLRIIVIATAIILSPLLAFAWGVANVSYAISRKSEFRKDLIAARDKMKQTEELRKFEALRNIYLLLAKEICKDFRPRKNTTEILEAIKDPQKITGDTSKDVEEAKKAIEKTLTDPNNIKIDLCVKRQKLLRELLRAEARNGTRLSHIADEAYRTLCYSLEESDFKTASALKEKFERVNQVGLSEEGYQKIIHELNLSNPNVCTAELSTILRKIITLFESPSNDLTKTNRLITKYLREALENPTYIALKEDNSCTPVVFLHLLAASIWTQTKVFDAYKELGKACLSPLSSPSKLHESLSTSHQTTSQKLLTDHGLKAKLFYALTHPTQALSSLASEGGLAREIAASFGFGTYDSHGQLSNNPSLQGTTSVRTGGFGGFSGKVLNSYGGSPTQGDHKIAPEFRAVCQAAENNLCSSKRIQEISDMIYYTNLQHIEGRHGEGDRSHTIMSLAYDFPLSFRGMTLAKDSEFYMMRKNRNALQWDLNEFSSEFLAKLEHEACYTFEGRKGTTEGNGIYLPGKKEEWKPVLEIIFRSARRRFDNLKAENSEQAYKLRGAFIEYVYSMIQAYMEVNLLIDVKDKVHFDPLVMTVSACKENIDRGGMANTLKLYTRLASDTPEEERVSLLAGAMHSRALSARNRVILAARMPQTLAFIEHVKAEDFQNDLQKVFEETGIEVYDFTFEPAV